MFGPSGDLIGQILPYWDDEISLIENEALSFSIPPGPPTVILLKLSSSDSGFVWSTIVDNWLVLKNEFKATVNGFEFTICAGLTVISLLIKLILSFISLSALTIPTLIPYVPTNSPTVLNLLFPRWSMSSKVPFPTVIFIRYLRVSIISVLFNR